MQTLGIIFFFSFLTREPNESICKIGIIVDFISGVLVDHETPLLNDQSFHFLQGLCIHRRVSEHFPVQR